MDWTDRHCRYFLRLLTPNALLYTEMVTTGALLHGDRERFLRHDPTEHPVAFQLGGSDPAEMAACAHMGADWGYDEVNINVGCPSDRVQNGRFGACLMAEPGIVADCVAAMKAAVDVPITVKTRIGIDDRDSYEELAGFTDTVLSAGCDLLIVHARKAWLKGLSPKENRTVPPLNYERVYQLKQNFPALEIVINGGLTTAAQVDEVLKHVDGAMIGRQAYHQPYFLAELEHHFNPGWHRPSRADVVEAMLPYIERELAAGVPFNRISRHMLGLFAEQPGARAWRRYISEHAHREGAGSEVLVNALNAMPAAA